MQPVVGKWTPEFQDAALLALNNRLDVKEPFIGVLLSKLREVYTNRNKDGGRHYYTTHKGRNKGHEYSLFV